MAKRSEVRKRTPKGLTDKQKKMLRAVIGGAIPPVGAVMLIQNLIKKRDDRPGKGPGSGPKKKRKLGPDIRARKSAISTAFDLDAKSVASITLVFAGPGA